LWFKKDDKDWNTLPVYVPGLNAGTASLDGGSNSD